MGRSKWIGFLVVSVLLLVFFMANQSEAQGVGSNSCIRCHETWRDNAPSLQDIAENNVDFDYLPPFITSIQQNSFYTIPEGYLSSMHNSPIFNPTATDYVTCEACHGSGVGHQGIGAIPKPIPDAKTCSQCHNETVGFPYKQFLKTSHGQTGASAKPTKNFDQPAYGNPNSQATFPLKQGLATTRLLLFKTDGSTEVTRNERLEECNVCHNYALQSAQFKKYIGKKAPQVSCAACHNAHHPAPKGDQLLPVNVAQVGEIAGTSTIIRLDPAVSRSVSYRNLKPYKTGDDGAQDLVNGTWGRGSLVSRPNTKLIGSPGTITDGPSGPSTRLTYPTGGFLAKVKPEDTVFISAVLTGNATITDPAAVLAGKRVTVQTTFAKAGFEVHDVVSDTELDLAQSVTTTASVTYRKTPSGTGTLSVPVTLSNPNVEFEIRDMRTNIEGLCGSCHTQGTYKYTAVGKNKDGTVNPAVTPATHNKNILGQYKNSGHGNIQNLAFLEFSAFDFGSSHQVTYPFDMKITGSGGVGSLRNPGNITHQLTTPDAANAYLTSTQGVTSQPVLINNYACNQCHHGLGSIDYQKNRQGTPDASVLWGDATVTCVTCHDPHADATKTKKNIRVPVKLSYNSRFTEVGGSVNKFLDGTAIPAEVGDGIICLFCHQARESGLTIYRAMKAANAALDPYATPDALISASGISFVNPHYLDGGAILWSKNAWEYSFNGVRQKYTTGYKDHQDKNCAGCHMDNAKPDNSEGGHTWKPNIETCNTKCHTGVTDFKQIAAFYDYDGDGVAKTTYEELGTITPRPAPGVGSTGTGLFGLVVAALETKGIYYNPDGYPYFFTATGGQFRAFTPNTLSAAFNLAYSYKAGNAVYVHNAKYNIQILRDALQTLNGGVVPPGVRPGPATGTTNLRDATYYPDIDLTQ